MKTQNEIDYEEAREIVAELPGVSIGYIGNCERWGDDRSWRVFLPHPGRVGTSADCLGSYPTAERGKLLRHALELKSRSEIELPY